MKPLSPSKNPRRALRDWYIVLVVYFLLLGIIDHGSWWLLGDFAFAVFFTLEAQAEHRAIKTEKELWQKDIENLAKKEKEE